MPTTPATQVAYSFVTAASATEYTIPQWIQASTDVSVYFGTVLQTTGYTIGTITDASYVLTFSTAPDDGITVFIFRSIIIDQPGQFNPGAAITETDLNLINNNFYLENIDADYKLNNLAVTYEKTLLTTSGTLTEAMLTFPLPVAPSGGINTVMAWNGTAWVSVPIASTGSAAALKTELASTSTPQGASLVGYYKDGNTTVQNELDNIFLAATSLSSSGAANIPCWNITASEDTNIQGMINNFTTDATISDSGAGYITYWNGSSSVSVQTQLDNTRTFRVGDFIAGVPTQPYPSGSWIQVNATHSIGSAASGATHPLDAYEALYIFIRESYLGEATATAQAAWDANTPITPSTLADNPVPGTNAWRYA